MFKCKDAARKYYREYARKYRAAHPGKDKESCAKYYASHREEAKARARAYYAKNKEKARASQQRYEKEHLDLRRTISATHRAAKQNACPPWMSGDLMQELKQVYAWCPEGMEVDHIIPLQGENVCGLHVVCNLQYLTESENCSKRAKFDGTYDNEGWRKCA
jgi:hypothetical protein